MKKINTIFFGSTTDSVIILETLNQLSKVNLSIGCIVTQPPRPIGRKQLVTQTPVEVWAHAHNISVLSFANNNEKPWLYEDETNVINALSSIKPDLIISASYGQKIPWETISNARFGGLNVHPSILPRWRGADPVPWAILSGDAQIGVTVVRLSEKFDDGKILAQHKIPLTVHDTSDPLRTKLFSIGATLLSDLLPKYLQGKVKEIPQHDSDTPRAKKFTRADGFESWETLREAMHTGTDAERIERKYRAFTPWPGIWSKLTNLQNNKVTIQEEKRIKILALHLDNEKLVIDQVQLEGKNPVSWKEFSNAYIQQETS